MKNNVYICAAEKVREMKAAEALEIPKTEIMDYVRRVSNIREVDRKELEEIVISFMSAVALSQNNCYSIKRGCGNYINVDLCEKLEPLMLIEHNLSEDLRAKIKAIRKIQDMQRGILEGQIDFEDIGVGCG